MTAPFDPAPPGERRPYRPPRLRQLAEAGLRQEGHLWLRVSGESMLPLLRDGDRVEIRPAAPEDLRRGDLLVFQQGEHLLVHRLVARHGADWVARGDNLPDRDPPIPLEAVLGKVRRVDGRAGHIDLARGPWPAAQALLGYLAGARRCGGRRDRLLARLQAVLTRGLLRLAAAEAPADRAPTVPGSGV